MPLSLSLPLVSLSQEVAAARPGVPLIAFPKDQPLPSFVASSFSAVSLGWGAERETAKARFQQGVPLGVRPPLDAPGVKALQGNLDPHILYAPDEAIRQQTAAMVSSREETLRLSTSLSRRLEGLSPSSVAIVVVPATTCMLLLCSRSSCWGCWGYCCVAAL